MIELWFVVDDDAKACDKSHALVDDDAQVNDKSKTTSLEGFDNGNIKLPGMILEFPYSTFLFTYSSTIEHVALVNLNILFCNCCDYLSFLLVNFTILIF